MKILDVQGCGTIRVMYPYFLLNHFREISGIQIGATHLSSYVNDLKFYKNFTFVQFQRSASKHHLEIYKQFKSNIQPKLKIPLVFEIDDLLVDIPKWNYAHKYYKNNEDNVKQLLSMANGVITSTYKLKEIYSEYNNNIDVIQNHLPKFIWGGVYKATDYYDSKNKIKILWAGSSNHFAVKDMKKEEIKGGDFGKKLIKFIEKTTDKYDWHLMGAMPVELEHVRNKIKFHKWVNIFQYPSTVKSIEPDICIAPLEDNRFNSCKSNIKSLEYIACGAASVFSDVEPYKTCTMKAKTDEEMIDMIEKLAEDIDLRSRIFESDLKKLKGQLWWEEDGNLRKYINTYLKLFGKKL